MNDETVNEVERGITITGDRLEVTTVNGQRGGGLAPPSFFVYYAAIVSQ